MRFLQLRHCYSAEHHTVRFQVLSGKTLPFTVTKPVTILEGIGGGGVVMITSDILSSEIMIILEKIGRGGGVIEIMSTEKNDKVATIIH